jgi:hypothetical protein
MFYTVPVAEVQPQVDPAEAAVDTSLHDDDVEDEEEAPVVTGPCVLATSITMAVNGICRDASRGSTAHHEHQ